MDFNKNKENAQPSRGGQTVTQLEAVPQDQSSAEVQMQLQLLKQEHEALLLKYEGPDPFDPWFNYIQWIEQSFPKHGHEGHIDKLIKDCLQKFEKDKRYYQDRRFIKLWIRYIDCLSNPLELYQTLYDSGIGVKCSEFYRAWACYCEEFDDFKKADQVYVLGIEAQAQPFDELEQAQINFRVLFAQRMLYDDLPTKRKAATALAETRTALASLSTFKRRKIASVFSQRTGDSSRSIVPNEVRTQQSQAQANNRPGTSNIMRTVYQDQPSTSHGPVSARNVPVAASLLDAGVNAEHEKEVGNRSKKPKTKSVAAQSVPHQQIPVLPTLYEDEDENILSPHSMSYCLDDSTTSHVPLYVPDPPQHNNIPCYNKAADQPSTSHGPVSARNVPVAASLLDAGVNAEHEKEVGNRSKKPKTNSVAAQSVPHQQIPVLPTLYEDEELILSPHHMNYCVDDLTTFCVPLYVPETPEHINIPCYNKAAVYKNNTEYSLEEIRSNKYLDRYRLSTTSTVNVLTQSDAITQNNKVQHGVHTGGDGSASSSSLQTFAACALQEQDQLMPLNIPVSQNITKEQHVLSPRKPHVLVNLNSKESQMANPNSENPSSCNQIPLDDSNRRPNPKEGLMQTFYENSVTDHTKAARWELRNIFIDANNTGKQFNNIGRCSMYAGFQL